MPSKPDPKASQAKTEKERLVDEALAVHRRQQQVLEALDPKMRQRLQALAERAFATDPSSRGGGSLS